MSFEEIFNHDGLYVSESFAKGSALRVYNGTLYLVSWANENSFFDNEQVMPVYKGLFEKDYKKVFK